MVAAHITQQAITANRRDKNIRPSIVVKIRGGDAHAVQFQVRTGRRADVGETPVSVIPVEPLGCRGGLFPPRPAFSVDKKQVLIAVMVIIENCDSAAHRLRQQPLAVGAIFVDETDAPIVSHSREMNLRRRPVAGPGELLRTCQPGFRNRFGSFFSTTGKKHDQHDNRQPDHE